MNLMTSPLPGSPIGAMEILPVLPFVLMLLAIAILPLAFAHWWEHNRNKFIVSLVLGLPMAGFLLIQVDHGGHRLAHALIEYFQFICLLASLYTISGGILLSGDIKATPRNNTCFLAVGALLASFVGTTGAAMLLIRPLLATNAQRNHVAHTVIFFIFCVANIGGCLTPLGDPPLFLGYLRGVPFTYFLQLWPQWLGLNIVLLLVYYFWDRSAYATEASRDVKKDTGNIRPLSLEGFINFGFLAGVIASVAFNLPSIHLDADPAKSHYLPVRELVMGLCVAGSLALTPGGLRQRNKFSFAAIIEVAALFLGIFITMVPALMLLEHRGPQMGVDSAIKYFWFSGALSSFLDNAPTFVTFFELAKTDQTADVARLGLTVAGQAAGEIRYDYLRAVALGSVFMGANTYIGNGPNFMVKAIAEEAGVAMPSFFGYMKYSLGILIPLFIGLTFVTWVLLA